MKFPPRLLLGLVIAALLISACAVTSRNALIGKWEDSTQGVTMEFTMDGHLRQLNQGVTVEFRYQFLNDTTISVLQPESAGGLKTLAFQIAGDNLTLKDPVADQSGQAQPIIYQRVK